MTPPWTWGSSAQGPPDTVSSETSGSLFLGLPRQGTRRSAFNNYLLITMPLKTLGGAETETDQFPDLVGLRLQWRETISVCQRLHARTHTRRGEVPGGLTGYGREGPGGSVSWIRRSWA